MNNQTIVDYMSLSSSVSDWNKRREEMSEALQLEYKSEMIFIKIRNKSYSIPKYLSQVNSIIDSGLIIKTLGNDSGKIYS